MTQPPAKRAKPMIFWMLMRPKDGGPTTFVGSDCPVLYEKKRDAMDDAFYDGDHAVRVRLVIEPKP